ncbi:hypothetical protein CR165_15065 [Pseudoroseomonas aestuarii]|uniref:Porin n=2 Tax=Teichococcus aestuarii TaxID=568898 RepID=A0A2U1V1Z7_9PROT|nr:hypothetical protein CR165_15065 [Pseudoroseomonas aestuarii]
MGTRQGWRPPPLRRIIRPMRHALLALLVLALPAAARAETAYSLGNGAVRLTPTLQFDADAGSYFGQNRPGGFRPGANLRRGYLGFEASVGEDVTFAFAWDFGGDPNDHSDLYEAWVGYSGLGIGTLRVGAYEPRHMLEEASSSRDLLFMESAAATNLASGLASGDTRLAIGLEANGERWTASGYVTGGLASQPNSWGQRGLVGRVTALLPTPEGLVAQLGVNGAYQFRPGDKSDPQSIALSDYPELRLSGRQLLDTDAVRASNAWAVGPSFSAGLGRFYAQAEYQRIGVETEESGGRQVQAWYLAGAYTLLGRPRRHDAEDGTWKRPTPEADSAWGAWELAGRYSAAELRNGPVLRGGAQRIWTAGLNWYPTETLAVMLNYQNGILRLDEENRRFQAIGLRLSFSL